MKKVFFAIATIAIIVSACNSKRKKNNTEEITKMDSIVPQKDSIATSTSKIAIDNNGALYISSDDEYTFRIICKEVDSNPLKILLRNETSGRIYDMERVISANGEKYQDSDGNYFWIKGDNFTFGKSDKILTEGSISEN